MTHITFFWEEFASMAYKGQWVVLPYLVAKDIPGLRISPPGVKEEEDICPGWLGGYSFINNNTDTLSIYALSTMQYDQVL